MAFSENLQFIRTQAGVTQEQLAEQLGVSRQSVSKWESGLSFPEMETLLRICDLYDVNLDTLLRGSVAESRVSDSARYDAFMNSFSRRGALAIGGILAGVALGVFLSTLIPELLSSAVILLAVTVAVVVLVASGIEYENFCKKNPVIADIYSPEEKDIFHQKFVWLISGGVGAILFGVVLLMLFFSVFPEREPYESWAATVFLLLLAGAVSAMVYGGIQDEKYKIWKYNRDNNPDPEAKRRLQLIGTLCGVIMLLATAAFLMLGFTRDSWSSAWWVFPVGGVLCAVVNVALNPYKDDD